jgi:hypothetical protein
VAGSTCAISARCLITRSPCPIRRAIRRNRVAGSSAQRRRDEHGAFRLSSSRALRCRADWRWTTALDLARGTAAGPRGVQVGGCAKASRHVGQHQFEKSRRSFSRQDTPSCGTQSPIPPNPVSMSSPSIAGPPAHRKGPSTGIRRIDQRWARQLEFVDPCDFQPQSGHKGPSSVESAV